MSGDNHNQADPPDLDANPYRWPVSLVGPIPAPDYTMRVNFAHEPLPDRNTRATVVDCM